MKGKISLEDLVEQFLDQCRSGNVPDIQDFAGAHPEFASELLALLPLVMEMEDWSVEKKQGIMPPVHDFPDLEGATFRLRDNCSASNTTPIPPLPSLRISR